MDKYREWPLGIPPKELQRKERRTEVQLSSRRQEVENIKKEKEI